MRKNCLQFRKIFPFNFFILVTTAWILTPRCNLKLYICSNLVSWKNVQFDPCIRFLIVQKTWNLALILIPLCSRTHYFLFHKYEFINVKNFRLWETDWIGNSLLNTGNRQSIFQIFQKVPLTWLNSMFELNFFRNYRFTFSHQDFNRIFSTFGQPIGWKFPIFVPCIRILIVRKFQKVLSIFKFIILRNKKLAFLHRGRNQNFLLCGEHCVKKYHFRSCIGTLVFQIAQKCFK